jgi:hypothetical protein
VPRCPACEEIIPAGCNCEVSDSDCFAWDGDGSQDDPYTLSAVLDASLDNLLSCSSAGLLGRVPTVISNPPAVLAFRSLNLTVANNTMTAVNLNQERYDTDTMHSTSANTNRVTFTTAGFYIVTFNCVWDADTVGNRIAQIRKNGADVLVYESKKAGGADLYVGHSLVVQDEFSAADYVEGMVQQTSGGNLRLVADHNTPALGAVYAA